MHRYISKALKFSHAPTAKLSSFMHQTKQSSQSNRTSNSRSQVSAYHYRHQQLALNSNKRRLGSSVYMKSPVMASGSEMWPPSADLAPGFVLWRSSVSGAFDEKQTSSSSSPVLVLLCTWLGCKPANASKYASMYTSRGFDVLQVSSYLIHFLWPPKSRKYAQEIAKILKLHCAEYRHIILHAMSIGAYNYTSCLQLKKDNAEIREFFIGKLCGVIFDSLTLGTLDHMVKGIATGISQWNVIQMATMSLANTYFLMTHKITVEAFNEGVEFFRKNPERVPTLVFASKNDSMCDTDALQSLLDYWKLELMLPVASKIWDKSGHCSHLIHHHDEYMQLLQDFISSLQLPVSQNECTNGQRKNNSKL